MRQPEELDNLLKIAEQRQDVAQKQWLAAKNKRRAAERQWQELKDYAAEYARSHVAAVSVGDLRNRSAFSERLALAVKQQGDMCQHAKASEQGFLQRWQQTRQKQKALEELRSKRLDLRRQNQQRREQRNLDEFALRALGREQ